MPTYVFDISNHLNSVSGAGSIANGGVEISIVSPNSRLAVPESGQRPSKLINPHFPDE
jgi:ADP-glucose pyrophosphorylase